MTASPQIEWPTGGFEWTKDLRAKLPIIRGIRAPDPKPAGRWAEPPAYAPVEPRLESHSRRQIWNLLVKQGLARDAEPWTVDEAEGWLIPERLKNPDPACWRELMARCAMLGGLEFNGFVAWLIEAAAELHGVAFATRWLLDSEREFNWTNLGSVYSHRIQERYQALREALAAAPEDECRAAEAAAAEFFGRHPNLDCIVAFLFPHVAAWAEAAAAHSPYWQEREFRRWLEYVILPPDRSRALLPRMYGICDGAALPGVLLHIHLHGENALRLLETLLDRGQNKTDRQGALRLIARMRTPAAISLLLARFEIPEVRATLDKFAERWPAACLALALECAAGKRNGALDEWISRLALRRPDAVEPALAEAGPAARERYARLAGREVAPEEAAEAALPELLRNPPWTREDRPPAPPVLDLAAPELPDTMAWPEGVRESWLHPQLGGYAEYILDWYTARRAPDPWCLEALGIRESAHQRAMAGELLSPEDFTKNKASHIDPSLALIRMTPKTAQTVWDSVTAEVWQSWKPEVLRLLFAQRELAALPRLLDYIAGHPRQGLGLALPFRSARFAPLAAHALRGRSGRADAMAWLRAHPETAITALIPPAFGKDRKARDSAQAALRWLATEGFEAEARRIAGEYGEAAAGTVDRLLGTDPIWMLPAKTPKLPAFFVAAACYRPVLKAGGALSVQAMEHLGTMLALSTPDGAYAGLAEIRRACTPESLAAFAWDVFEAWEAVGLPPKEDWAFTGLALLGDDETARRLVPKINAWAEGTAKSRAAAGLETLAAIGTEVAMQRLAALATQGSTKDLREKARRKLAEIAEARGLTEDELADRLVPELGLDENGTLVLDFGPRRFTVGFDENLQPFVRDESGVRLKALPKPGKKTDDPDKAKAAAERYKALKKDAQAIATQQIERLRKSMTGRRRWRPKDFRRFFLEHPLLRHLARRLVWGVYRGGEFTEAFRVAEDLSLADRRDDLYELPASNGDTRIGLAMAAEMPDGLRREFGQIFGDYEIAQPFRQLAREVYTLTEAERQSGEVARFEGRHIAGGSLNALVKRGWEESDRSYGFRAAFRKYPAGDVAVVLGFAAAPGAGGSWWGDTAQVLGKLIAVRPTTGERLPFGELSQLDISEALRDVDLLPPIQP